MPNLLAMAKAHVDAINTIHIEALNEFQQYPIENTIKEEKETEDLEDQIMQLNLQLN